MKRHRPNSFAASQLPGTSAMDGDESPGKRLKPTGSVIGASTTPLWHPSQVVQDESAMRSTLNPAALQSTLLPSPSYLTNIPHLPPPLSPATPRSHISDAMAIENLMNPVNMLTEDSINPLAHRNAFTPINGHYKTSTPRKPPLNTVSYSLQTGYSMLDMQIDMNQIDSHEVEENGQMGLRVDDTLMVDKEDGRMWHLGNDPKGSFSGTLIYDDPNYIYAPAMEVARSLREKCETPGRMAVTAPILQRVQTLVIEGCELLVERSSFVEDGEPIICERPGCRHQEQLPSDSYYVNVGHENSFCLRCFEMLWAGKFTQNVPVPEQFRRDSGVAFPAAPFDGPDDYRKAPRRSARLRSNSKALQDKPAPPAPPKTPQSDLHKSRWAVPEDQARPLAAVDSPVRANQNGSTAYEDDIDTPMEDSPSSIYSDGEWRYPPTEVQRIAHLMKAGWSLSERDKAAVALWQEASKVQLRWERHLAKTKATRAYYGGQWHEDVGLHAKPLELGQFLDIEQLYVVEKKTGVRIKDCNGRDLSHVLMEAAANKA